MAHQVIGLPEAAMIVSAFGAAVGICSGCGYCWLSKKQNKAIDHLLADRNVRFEDRRNLVENLRRSNALMDEAVATRLEWRRTGNNEAADRLDNIILDAECLRSREGSRERPADRSGEHRERYEPEEERQRNREPQELEAGRSQSAEQRKRNERTSKQQQRNGRPSKERQRNERPSKERQGIGEPPRQPLRRAQSAEPQRAREQSGAHRSASNVGRATTGARPPTGLSGIQEWVDGSTMNLPHIRTAPLVNAQTPSSLPGGRYVHPDHVVEDFADLQRRPAHTRQLAHTRQPAHPDHPEIEIADPQGQSQERSTGKLGRSAAAQGGAHRSASNVGRATTGARPPTGLSGIQEWVDGSTMNLPHIRTAPPVNAKPPSFLPRGRHGHPDHVVEDVADSQRRPAHTRQLAHPDHPEIEIADPQEQSQERSAAAQRRSVAAKLRYTDEEAQPSSPHKPTARQFYSEYHYLNPLYDQPLSPQSSLVYVGASSSPLGSSPNYWSPRHNPPTNEAGPSSQMPGRARRTDDLPV
jgi:hypothetical protein